jgi:hypothetical protein
MKLLAHKKPTDSEASLLAKWVEKEKQKLGFSPHEGGKY